MPEDFPCSLKTHCFLFFHNVCTQQLIYTVFCPCGNSNLYQSIKCLATVVVHSPPPLGWFHLKPAIVLSQISQEVQLMALTNTLYRHGDSRCFSHQGCKWWTSLKCEEMWNVSIIISLQIVCFASPRFTITRTVKKKIWSKLKPGNIWCIFFFEKCIKLQK